MSLSGATTSELLERMERGDLTAVEVATASLDAIRARDEKLKAFLHVDRDDALRQAETVDKKRRAGGPMGRLAGVPIALKDVVCTQGVRTTCASRIL